MKKQSTIRTSIIFNGIGVHSGKSARAMLSPAPINTGICIVNPDFPQDVMKIGTVLPIAAPHATVLESNEWSVSTIEHIMAAIYMLEIDNITIAITGGEAPILDGSAIPFVTKILEVGINQQDAARSYLGLREQIVIEDDDRSIVLTPSTNKTLVIDYDAGFDESLWGGSKISHMVTPKFCIEQLAPARTFGALKQWPMLKKMGLARGSSLKNTLVLGDSGFINRSRFKNECVRHKLLDFIGDLMLLGKPLHASIKAYKTGHAFNRSIIERFIAFPELFETVFAD